MSRNRSHSQQCPSCGEKALVTTTRKLTEEITERYYRCSNTQCAHVFKTQTEITGTIIPPINDEANANESN